MGTRNFQFDLLFPLDCVWIFWIWFAAYFIILDFLILAVVGFGECDVVINCLPQGVTRTIVAIALVLAILVRNLLFFLDYGND